jgi:hypothetical protein
LTVVPHVPDKSPVVGNARPSRGEKFVTAILVSFKPSFQRFPSWESGSYLYLPSRESVHYLS